MGREDASRGDRDASAAAGRLKLSRRRQAFERAAAENPAYPGGHEGDGIVICAGGVEYFTCAFILIGVLRRVLNCRLPIEVWHIGRDEMSPEMAALLADLGNVRIVDAKDFTRYFPHPRLYGWELKPYAVAHSRFKRVLLLDADNIPARGPAFLFDFARQTHRSAVFWPDFEALNWTRKVWNYAGLQPLHRVTFESGQLLIDKSQCWAPLMLALHMNENSDFWFEHIHGDKDTFFLAWTKLGAPYGMPPYAATHHASTIYQYDFDGAVLFQHRHAATVVFDQVVVGREDASDALLDGKMGNIEL